MDIEAVPSTVEKWAGMCREFVEELEEERRKIEVFQRELPLSLHLVTQTIESFRQQIAAEVHSAGGAVRSELEVEEETTSEGAPVLEEFIPIKRSSSSDVDDEEDAGDRRHDHQLSSNGHHDEVDGNSACNQKEHETPEIKKLDWLRSVQLWNQHTDPHPLPREDQEGGEGEDADTPPRPIAVEAKKATGAFAPFHSQKRSPPLGAAPKPAPPPSVQAPSSTSDATAGGGGGGENRGCIGGDEKDGQPHRKIRRCWSPELHRRFLNALQQLGGSDVATPKRIRELINVDGLTNDEVKSHLQKYRLHSRRPSPASQGSAANPPPQQVVFVGGIWVPPPGYAAAAAAARPTAEGTVTGPPNGIYAPIASVPAAPKQSPRQWVKQSPRSPSSPLPGDGGHGRDEQNVAGDDATRSNSPATSSSSRTTTTSAGRCR